MNVLLRPGIILISKSRAQLQSAQKLSQNRHRDCERSASKLVPFHEQVLVTAGALLLEQRQKNVETSKSVN